MSDADTARIRELLFAAECAEREAAMLSDLGDERDVAARSAARLLIDIEVYAVAAAASLITWGLS